MRKAEIKRNTSETKISLTLNLDGSGKAEIRSGCGFLDHMLTLFSRHALADLSLQLILCALDISGRGGFYPELNIAAPKVGDFDTELCAEFFAAFAREAGVTLHLRQLAGVNAHHIIEGCFKAFARALRTAVSPDDRNPDGIPSTKGVLG